MKAQAQQYAKSVLDKHGHSGLNTSFEHEGKRMVEAYEAGYLAALEKNKKKGELDEEIIHNMVTANQAAWIEWRHGEGADCAMQWIENGLAGPGFVPECDSKDAQEFYNKNAI